MKPTSSFYILFFMLLVVGRGEARKDPAEYWKSIMKDEPMPEAIEELIIHGENQVSLSELDVEAKNNMGGVFKRNFDTRPNLIIYHKHHAEHKKKKPKGFKETIIEVSE